MGILWTWTPGQNIKHHEDRYPHTPEGAKDQAASILQAHDADLECHHSKHDTKTAAGVIDIFLVYKSEDYEAIRTFLETPAAEKYRNELGEISPPGHAVPGL